VTVWLSLAIWIYLFAFRGGFWRLRERLGKQRAEVNDKEPLIAIVIPARDEALYIAETVTSLRSQRGTFRLDITVADDESSDETASLAARAGANRVIPVRPRPPQWKGKLWALREALEAVPSEAEFILFIDADIACDSTDVVQQLLNKGNEGYDLVTVMVHLRCQSFAEKMLVPAFVYFFFKLYPPSWVACKPGVAAAAGGCMLIRRDTLEKLGGIESYRSALIDDCALAGRVKSVGGRIWLGMSNGELRSTRGYDSAGVIRSMIARSAFAQLRHSLLFLVGTLAGMGVIYLAPLSFLFTRDPAIAFLALGAWLLGAIMFAPAVATFRAPVWTIFGLPLIALFYLAATVESAWNYWRGRGGVWKGRVQDML